MVGLNYRWKCIDWLSLIATNLSDFLLQKRNWEYTMQDCSKMDNNTLGHSLYTYLTENNLSFKPNLIRHDMKHILLGYEMKIEDELKLHAFLIGNKSYNLMGIIYLVICTLVVPEVLFKLRIHYKKGKSTKQLKHVELQDYAKYNLKELRHTLNVTI